MPRIIVSSVAALPAALLVLTASTLARAEDPPTTQAQHTEVEQQKRPLPPPRSYDDPRPTAPFLGRGGKPGPSPADVGVTHEAGIGGTQGYGRMGVLELGGALGFANASGFTQANLSPTIGWFFRDRIEISGIVNFNYVNANGATATYTTALAEPSFHFPLGGMRTLFGFVGVGLGGAYANDHLGFALAPRFGLNVLVGRSGILTPALQLVHNTTDVVSTSQGALVAVSTTYGANIGYTVMW